MVLDFPVVQKHLPKAGRLRLDLFAHEVQFADHAENRSEIVYDRNARNVVFDISFAISSAVVSISTEITPLCITSFACMKKSPSLYMRNVK